MKILEVLQEPDNHHVSAEDLYKRLIDMGTPEYAEKIGADWYAKDAKQSADIAKKFFGES